MMALMIMMAMLSLTAASGLVKREEATPRPQTQWPATEQPTTRRPATQPATRSNKSIKEGPRIKNYPSFLPPGCGRTDVGQTAIVGRLEADPGAWPWMAAIFINSSSANSAVCSGALVTERHVVTAAHCVVSGRGAISLPPNRFTIRLGDHDLFRSDDDVSPVDVPVVKVERHADFVPRSLKNDLAILTMERPVKFNKYVKPVCLPYGDDFAIRDLKDYRAVVTGWGRAAFEGETSAVLKETSVTIWDQDDCKSAFRRQVSISEVYLCVDDGFRFRRQDSCIDDSGAPLVRVDNDRFFLIGVRSFGKPCGTVGYPALYTRLTQFLPWISERLQ